MASIIIPSYNGRELLARCLPLVIGAVEYDGRDHEMIVVDDGSHDDSASFIRESFHRVKVVQLKKNYGFSIACNRGVEKSQHDILIFLNNDIVVEKDFIAPLLRHFQNDDVFAVSPRIILYEEERGSEGGMNGLLFRHGLLLPHDIQDRERESSRWSQIIWASGGCVAYDKAKFLRLNGFDTVYSPFYYEDVDICYRACKRGWKVIYEASSVVHHYYQSTIRKIFNRGQIELISIKNLYSFNWKNLTDTSYVFSHAVWLIPRIIKSFVRGDFIFLKALLWATQGILIIWQGRKRERKQIVKSDREILDYFLALKNRGKIDGTD